jgi:hypothetical protein
MLCTVTAYEIKCSAYRTGKRQLPFVKGRAVSGAATFARSRYRRKALTSSWGVDQ